MPQYAMFGREETLPVVLGVSYIFSREENNVSMDRRYVRGEAMWVQENERSSRRKSEAKFSDVQTVNPEHQSGCLVWYFDPRISQVLVTN